VPAFRACRKAICGARLAKARPDLWDQLMDVITAGYDGGIQMIDSTSVRA
jgi:hypothetical protein